MPKPDLLQLCPFPAADQAALDADFAVHRLDLAADRAAFLATIGPRIRAIATSGGRGVDPAILAACPSVEIIAVYGVGVDGIDLDLARVRGIAVTNTPDVLTEDCADLALAMYLALMRGVVAADAFVRGGQWQQGSFPLTRRAWGARAGILGLGRIGMAIGRRLQAMGCDIAYGARAPKPAAAGWQHLADPVALAERSDVLFVALAATAATRHIVGDRVLRALGPRGLLVNISRAANVDETALLTALETGTIAGAALDVFEGEPALDPRFLTAPNVLLQPHHASGTVETRAAMGALMRQNLTAHFAGAPLPTPVV